MCIVAADIGEPPVAFLPDDVVRENLRRGEILEKPEGMISSVWELVVSMTKVDPAERLPLETVIDQLQFLVHGDFTDQSQPKPAGCASVSEGGSRFDTDDEDGEGSSSPDEEPSSSFDESKDRSVSPDHFAVADVVSTLTNSNVEAQEETLLRLIQACLDPEQRKELAESNGFPVLVELAKHGSTDFIFKYLKVCALGWCAELNNSFSETEYKSLRQHVRDSTYKENPELAYDIWHGTIDAKLKVIVYCATEARGSDAVQNAGIVAPLVAVLRLHNEDLTLWAMNGVGNIADDDETRDAFTQEGAIAPLLGFLKSGSSDQRALAAHALGGLVTDHSDNYVEILDNGAIAEFVELLTGGTDIQKKFAAFVLESVAEDDCEANWLKKANDDVIPALIHLLRVGTNALKSHEATTLGSLASNGECRARLARDGVIEDLVTLFHHGTRDQKERVVTAFFSFTKSAENSERMVNSGAVELLVESFESGSDDQIEHTIYTLEKFASHSIENVNTHTLFDVKQSSCCTALLLPRSGTSKRFQQSDRPQPPHLAPVLGVPHRKSP